MFNSDKVPEIFNKMADMSGLDNYSVALFRQDPGQINPWHFDTYQGVVNKYKKQGYSFLSYCTDGMLLNTAIKSSFKKK